jgi:hypothetical protein
MDGFSVVRLDDAGGLQQASSVTISSPMHHSRKTARWIVLLCLLAFQAQVMAGIWLDCKHSKPTSEFADCTMHAVDRSADATVDGDQPFKCAKCALAVAFGVIHGLPSATVTRALPTGSDQYMNPASFYYRFFPDRAARPPDPPIA